MCVHSDNEEGHLKISAKYSVSLNLTQIIYHRQKDYSLFFILESVYLLMVLGKRIFIASCHDIVLGLYDELKEWKVMGDERVTVSL